MDFNKWRWTPQEEDMTAVKAWRPAGSDGGLTGASDESGQWFPVSNSLGCVLLDPWVSPLERLIVQTWSWRPQMLGETSAQFEWQWGAAKH